MSPPKEIPEAVKRYVFVRDGWHCRNCNRADGLDPHHVIYRSHGGKDVENNLITLCRWCHNDEHEGRLEIRVIEVQERNIIVEFWRVA